jgi:hypothetical protein
MKKITTILIGYLLLHFVVPLSGFVGETDTSMAFPFGKADAYALKAENTTTGNWWEDQEADTQRDRGIREWFRSQPREGALAFALYTHHEGVLKLTAQCFPLYPGEPKAAVLELFRDDHWHPVQVAKVQYPGWSLHFRVENWDNRETVPYRVRLGDLSTFEGTIRKDPKEKDTIVVANMSCNSHHDATFYERAHMVGNLLEHDPDLLFFAGDQYYIHDEPTYGWLLFGVQFRDVLRDRPTVCLPDDHDVGHPNLFGDGGRPCTGEDWEGGYLYPPAFVNMVQRQQTWNLPDPYDPTPVKQGISVYYTDLTLGGINFAIVEDRKWKSGPQHNPKRPGTRLLGERQLAFLDAWARDWEGAVMKVALSQTAWCGHAHFSGHQRKRIPSAVDTGGWPKQGRMEAVRALRRARATHLCGDQHLGAVVQHGIEQHRDGPFSFTSPALVNTIWGRWWWPESEAAGGGEPIDSVLPWVGDYLDPFKNRITMIAYANAPQVNNQELKKRSARLNRGDGYGIARFHKATGEVTFECYPRFADLSLGEEANFPGWPVTFNVAQNDGRQPVGYLPEVELPAENAVVALINEATYELIYCYRVNEKTFRAPVYAKGRYSLRAGIDRPDTVLLSGIQR